MNIIFHPIYVALPLLIVLLFFRPKSKISAILNLLCLTAYIYILFIITNWLGYYSYYFRYVHIIFVLLLVIKTIYIFNQLHTRYVLIFNTPKLILLILFLIQIFEIHEPSIYPESSINLSFPFKNGSYVVTQGGKTRYLNYHLQSMSNEKQAIDISKINELGSPLKSIFQNGLKNSQFIIFRDSVFSPCDGVLKKINNYSADHEPSEFYKYNPESPNMVKINVQGLNVIIAHFLKETISLKVGDSIKAGDFLGLVGNSGQSTAPHLHIHAEKNDLPVRMLFNGEYLTKNDLVCL